MIELPKAYDAKSVEPKWLGIWEKGRFFHANPLSTKPPFCIVIPPPNVTGMLHMGHALVNTLQDVLVRWMRMQGREVLWVPGVDHAGIATQTVVERKLIQTHGKKRVDFKREEFLKHIWQWKDENEQAILTQLKKIGCSCDFERGRFTMDAGNNKAVRTTFKKLYDAGLIYRGDYLVNWDPVTQTALADDEVEYEDREGFIWHLKYPIKEGKGFVVIATTRPETMLGDTAVAVNPKDDRYKSLIGQMIAHPLTGREIPIIADPFIDPTFGTGAVKITPAHDPNDYQMAFRHNLPFITMMTPDGKVNERGGPFQGLTMAEARKAVVKSLTDLGLLVKIEPHHNRVGVSYRSKAVIEPFISKQWFIKMEPFKAKLKSCVAEGRVRLIPKNWENTYFHWIDNLRDWCISRQLWWGHRIPIWYKKSDPTEKICLDQETFDDPEWEQDPDVLDTWFSSALWPFAALGWPEKNRELAKFYPNSTLITGHDILFFWVARMLMMGEYVMENPPFPEVFIHGLIFGKSYWRKNSDGGGITYVTSQERQEYDLGKPLPKEVEFRWEKMSKSKGNVIDPLEIIEEYGTDALRMTMCASATQAREIDLDRRKFEDFRNFANKFWNGARFVFLQIEDLTREELLEGLNPSLYTLEDRWILTLLNQTLAQVQQFLKGYEFDKASLKAYDFFWKEFCSTYVEISKATLFGKTGTAAVRKNKQKLLVTLLDQSIRLLHPMAPFITEELFSLLKSRYEGSLPSLSAPCCALAPYPTSDETIDTPLIATFQRFEDMVYTIRNLRGEMKLPPAASPPIHITGPKDDRFLEELRAHPDIITGLVKTVGLKFEPLEVPFQSSSQVGQLRVAIPLPEELIAQEEQRLRKEYDRLQSALQKIEAQLANSDFTKRAPPELIAKTHHLLEQTRLEFAAVGHKLKQGEG